MPASFMAAETPSAVASICTLRPISSAAKARVSPMPMARRLPAAAVSAVSRQNTSRWGESPPSVPPDMTMATRRSISDGAQVQALGQHELQGERGVAAGEVVDAAVALGLADDGHDGCGIDLALLDGS